MRQRRREGRATMEGEAKLGRSLRKREERRGKRKEGREKRKVRKLKRM